MAQAVAGHAPGFGAGLYCGDSAGGADGVLYGADGLRRGAVTIGVYGVFGALVCDGVVGVFNGSAAEVCGSPGVDDSELCADVWGGGVAGTAELASRRGVCV